MHNKTDIDLIFESYNQRVLEESEIDFDALFLKEHDRLPESKQEEETFMFDVLNAEVSNGVSMIELVEKYGEDAVKAYVKFGAENNLFEGPFEDAEEDGNDQYAPEDAPEDDQFGEIEPEEDESVGEFDEFIEKVEKFVDAIGDDELEFLSTLRKDQFEVLMDVVSDQVGYRDRTDYYN